MRSLIADLGDAYCLELRRTAIGPFEVADADAERIVPLDDALAFLPAVELDGRRRPPRRPRRGGRPRAADAARSASATSDGLIAHRRATWDGTSSPS